MSNPLYNVTGSNQPSLMQTVQQFKANPMQMLNKRFNLPQNMAVDPNAILQYLMQTGQVTQEQLNAKYQQAQRLGFRR